MVCRILGRYWTVAITAIYVHCRVSLIWYDTGIMLGLLRSGAGLTAYLSFESNVNFQAPGGLKRQGR
jgi:hypothetical protein